MSTALVPPTDTSWLQPYLDQTARRIIAEGITLSVTEGLVISPDVPDSVLAVAFVQLNETRRKNKMIAVLMDRYIGQLIITYSARHDCDWVTTISDLGLVEASGRPYKALAKLARMVSQLPDEVWQFSNLTTTHFDVATAFKGPIDDVRKMQEFNEKRFELLRIANNDPENYRKVRLLEEMRAIQISCGVVSAAGVPVSHLTQNFIRTSLLLDFSDEELESMGTSRRDVREHWDSYRNELIERGRFGEDFYIAEKVILPWAQPYAANTTFSPEPTPDTDADVITVEVVHQEDDEEDDDES